MRCSLVSIHSINFLDQVSLPTFRFATTHSSFFFQQMLFKWQSWQSVPFDSHQSEHAHHGMERKKGNGIRNWRDWFFIVVPLMLWIVRKQAKHLTPYLPSKIWILLRCGQLKDWERHSSNMQARRRSENERRKLIKVEICE